MSNRVVQYAIFGAVTLFSAGAMAQDVDVSIGGSGDSTSVDASSVDFARGVRASGMGEAYTGVASGTAGVYHNPAGVARTVMYSLEGVFEYTPAGSLLNASIVDSKTNPAVAAGVAYSYFFGRGELENVGGHDVRVALGVPVVPNRVSVGVGGRYLNFSQSISGEDEDLSLLKGFTLDVGVLFRMAEKIHLGVAGQNLIDPCGSNDLCRGMAPTTITGGLAFGSDVDFLVSADVGIDITSRDNPVVNIGVGSELLLADVIPLRLGFLRRGATESNYLTAGAGWRSASAGIDLSYQHNLDASEFGYMAGSFSLYF